MRTKATFKVIEQHCFEEIQLHDFQLDEAQYQFLLRFLQQLDPVWRIPAKDSQLNCQGVLSSAQR